MNIPWNLLAPECILAVAAAVILLVELLLKKEESRFLIYLLTLASLGASAYFLISEMGSSSVSILEDTYLIEAYSQAIKLLLVIGTAMVVLLSSSFTGERKFAEGEFYVLLLTATLGAMILTSSNDLITLYVGMELLSLSAYILVGLQKDRADSNESAWKYVVYGGVSSAFFLYGSSFLYGITGSTNLREIAYSLPSVYQMGYEPYFYIAFFFLLVGVGFKMATAPFHMWVPDVYQGASGSVIAFLSIVSKTAAFLLALRVFLVGFAFSSDGQWQQVLQPAFLLIAMLSMLWGAIVALRQNNVKRILAYSSITHAGYLLVAFVSETTGSSLQIPSFLLPSLYFYLAAYLLMSLGSLAVLSIVENAEKEAELNRFQGLAKRSPLLAFAFSFFLIAMAGIPLTGGFIGKFYLLLGALSVGSYVLVTVMLISTVISYAVYFRIIRQMYFVESTQETESLPVPFGAGLVILISLVGTLLLGILPGLVLDQIPTLF
ncbi:NADH-quinone oxidoreductase subunit N [Risungbinella massiliensis]|uniref:NADH-quinone oxidoreductase subunit N n=1 Tax=Risungbinella massiliensis TaxID=1329796 RepID=UPI0005CC2C5F|nr:NADH-quinone oxidoreductase subunit N [Risungbinella massiliensis]